MVVVAISDVLTMNFFWLVRDEGSWLDIGTSISHFFIASLLCVFVSGLEFVSEIFVSGVEVGGEFVDVKGVQDSESASPPKDRTKVNGHSVGGSNGSLSEQD